MQMILIDRCKNKKKINLLKVVPVVKNRNVYLLLKLLPIVKDIVIILNKLIRNNLRYESILNEINYWVEKI